MSIMDVLPAEAGLAVTAVTITSELIGIAFTTTGSAARCPTCGAPSDRVHSRYVRTIADLPLRDRRVAFSHHRPPVPVSERRVRAGDLPERVPGLVSTHACSTGPLTESHRAIGFAVGGEAGARLAVQLANRVSKRPTGSTHTRRPPISAGEPVFSYNSAHASVAGLEAEAVSMRGLYSRRIESGVPILTGNWDRFECTRESGCASALPSIPGVTQPAL